MVRSLLLVLTGPLAACAPPAPLALDAGASSPPGAILVAEALPPAEAPTLPVPLRPGTTAHGAAPTTAARDDLAPVLDAYLAVHAALVADRLDAPAARRFADAFVALVATAPTGDPHLWHRERADVADARAAADALAEAATLADARAAFGVLSAAFVRLVAAAGVPEGYAVAAMRCGMAPGGPDGGVWLQRPGATANPYFGAAMLACGSATPDVAPVPPHTH